MTNKCKILFYGNCQLTVVANYFQKYLDGFDVQICTDCGLQPFWISNCVFAVWSPENVTRQHKYVKCVHEKIRQSDVFVFQDHSGTSVIDELKTKFLCTDVAGKNTRQICSPDTRLFVHPTDATCISKQVAYLKTQHHDSDKIINELQNSTDPVLTDLLKKEFPFSNTFEKLRNENYQRYIDQSKIYSDCVNMNDYIEQQYKTKILTYSHNHMSPEYFLGLINKLLIKLNVIHEINIQNIVAPDTSEKLHPGQFRYFTEMFPDMDYVGVSGRKLEPADIFSLTGEHHTETVHEDGYK